MLSLEISKENAQWLTRYSDSLLQNPTSPEARFWNRALTAILKRLAGLKHGEIYIELANTTRRRTIKMNRLYWLWMRVLSQHTGYSKGGLHELLMHRAGFHDIIELAEEVHVIRWSSAKLTVDQFTELMREAEEIADKISCPLPYPEEIRHAA